MYDICSTKDPVWLDLACVSVVIPEECFDLHRRWIGVVIKDFLDSCGYVEMIWMQDVFKDQKDGDNSNSC